MKDNSEQNSIEKLYMSSPCNGCPFRKGQTKVILTEGMIETICEQVSFICHKTGNTNQKQCAGHMILRGDKNHFVAIAENLNYELTLKDQDKVFKSEEDLTNYHKNNLKKDEKL